MVSVSQGELHNSYGVESGWSTSAQATTSNHTPGQQLQAAQDPDDLDGQYTTLFCRALYKYEAQDSSALSFNQGDIIEVLSQQPSGWWDGLLGEERGWFPSNYVTLISDEEADQAFSGSEMSTADYSSSTVKQDHSTLDMSEALMRGSQSENEEWLDNELSFKSGTQPAPTNGASNKAQPGDYWMPEITQDNQIWYVNERTGQRARDIPMDSEDEVSDSDLAGLASQSSSRSTTSVNAPFAPNGSSETSHSSLHSQSTTEATSRVRTPEPWVKKSSGDGTYYYYNPLDGTAQWVRPQAGNDGPSQATTDTSQLFTESSSRLAESSRLSVYSDSSDVHPLDYTKPRRAELDREPVSPSELIDPGIMELESAEEIAKSLQETLEPPPVAKVSDLSGVATVAIQAVVENIQANGVGRQLEEYAFLDELVSTVVVAVRNLLYVAAIPTGHISSSVLPRGVRDVRAQAQQASPLKPVQRRVTATLSRLVLSARAMQYDSGSQLADTLNRIETDAEELERAVQSFVGEVQRIQDGPAPSSPPKRLEGVFSTANVGPGLLGAGEAGSWTGFGWVSLDNDASIPKKTLGPDVVSDVNSYLSSLQDTIAGLAQALRITNESSVEQVRQKVQQTVTQVSAFVSVVADIHIARRIDIDGIRQGEVSANNDEYSESVASARKLVRTLETVLQALYDDSAALLLTTQNLPDGDTIQPPGERESSYDLIDKLSTSLSSNLSQCRQTIEAILRVGHDQEEMAQGDYTNSIQWRESRLSMIKISNQVNAAHLKDAEVYDSENEGVVNLEDAFGRPGGRKLSSANESPYEAHRGHTNGQFDDGYVHPNGSASSVDNTTIPLDRDTELDGDISDDDLAPKPVTRSAKQKDLGTWLGAEYADKVAADSVAWYLRPSYSPSDIIIENDGSVRAGTVPALVEKLTAHEQLTDRTYTEAFLMTFKSFTTLDELVVLLAERFRIAPPDGLTPAEMEEWTKLKKNIIQIRVMNTLKSVIQGEDIIEREDMQILDKIKAFIQSNDVNGVPASKQLLNLVERAQRGNDMKAMVNTTLSQPPPPIAPKSTKKLRLTDVDPLELARQLTIMESNLYQRIKPMECLLRAREQKTDNIDNIALVIQTSNRIADWVADLVLSKEDSRKRAQIVKHLINVADRCRTLQNFSTMIAITSGLNTPPIRRLKRTWEQVNPRYMAMFSACEKAIDSKLNFNEYRKLMASVTPPCVPFIGVFLSTLQFIQDGNPDILPGGLINFRKRQKASEVISDIKRWQTQSFNLQALPVVLNYIEESLNQFSDTRASSDHFWQLSLEREPREREDEKMARLLQESGFL